MTSRNPLMPLIGRGLAADVAASHSVIPGVVRERYALGAVEGETPLYDVEIAGPGGRAHRLMGITGGVYCQVGHTVWVGIPYGDPHRSATILGRQLPGVPRSYGADDRGFAAVKFLGHPQTYAIEAEVEISDPTTRRWTEPVTRLTGSVRVTVLGEADDLAWYDAPVALSGAARPDLTVEIPYVETQLTTAEAGDPPHGHEVNSHSHRDGPLTIGDGFDGPFDASLKVDGILNLRDYDVAGEVLARPGNASFTGDISMRLTISATSPAVATLISARIVEIGVYTR